MIIIVIHSIIILFTSWPQLASSWRQCHKNTHFSTVSYSLIRWIFKFNHQCTTECSSLAYASDLRKLVDKQMSKSGIVSSNSCTFNLDNISELTRKTSHVSPSVCVLNIRRMFGGSFSRRQNRADSIVRIDMACWYVMPCTRRVRLPGLNNVGPYMRCKPIDPKRSIAKNRGSAHENTSSQCNIMHIGIVVDYYFECPGGIICFFCRVLRECVTILRGVQRSVQLDFEISKNNKQFAFAIIRGSEASKT